MEARLRALVEALCSERCAGRRTGTPEGRAARAVVADAFRAAGVVAVEQPIPEIGGANLVAALEGRGPSGAPAERWVLVGAHYDHLGRDGLDAFWGADDNAAAVAILVELARALAAARPAGRGVVLAAFDAEEPPHFLSGTMGSERFARAPLVPLARIDLMVCMDLVGHAFGPPGLPPEVRDTVCALGAQSSRGTAALVARLARAERGLVVRRLDADVIPPLSDYHAFRERSVPFLFLSCGRSRVYHTRGDTPAHLDYPKMAALARWLERFVRETCARPEPRVEFVEGGADDRGTLRTLGDLCRLLVPFAPLATPALGLVEDLSRRCEAAGGKLSPIERMQVQGVVERMQEALA